MPVASLSSILKSKYARVLTLVLILQSALFYTASHGENIIPVQALDRLPRQIGSWSMLQQGVVEKETLDVLKADDTLTRVYGSQQEGGSASLFVAYFRTQRTGQSPHSPKNCLPGAGWTQSVSGFVDVPIKETQQNIRINRYIVSKGDEKSVVLYWYQTPRRAIADEYDAKFWLVADSIRYHRSDTALVRVIVPVFRDQDQKAVDLGIKFVQSVYPILRGYLPIAAKA
jgi:EpsI family protein